MMENGYSLADIRTAVDGNNGGGLMGGNGIWLIVLFLIFFGFGGMGFGGNNGGALTRAEMTEGFRNTHVLDGIEGVAKGVCQSTYALNNSIMGGFNGLGQALQNCCCTTQKEIIENRYANEKNACDIVNAIHADGEATRALMRDQEVQKLRDDLQTAQLTLGNANQTRYILSQLGKYGINQPIWNCNPNCGYGC